MGLDVTSCAQFAALSLVKSVLTHVRAFVTVVTFSLMNLPIYSYSTEGHDLPNFYLVIYFYLIISGIESNVMVGLRLSDNSHGEQDDISG